MKLQEFHPAVAAWFRERFQAATPVQERVIRILQPLEPAAEWQARQALVRRPGALLLPHATRQEHGAVRRA